MNKLGTILLLLGIAFLGATNVFNGWRISVLEKTNRDLAHLSTQQAELLHAHTEAIANITATLISHNQNFTHVANTLEMVSGWMKRRATVVADRSCEFVKAVEASEIASLQRRRAAVTKPETAR